MKSVAEYRELEQVPPSLCRGTRLTWREFWRMTRDPKARSGYSARLIRDVAGAIDLDFEGAYILDIACGVTQRYVGHLWQGNAYVVGVDFDAGEIVQNRSIDAGARGDMHAIPFGDQTFDIIVSVDTLEHSANPAAFLEAASRILRPGGKLLITTPHLWGYKNIIAKLGGNLAHAIVWRLFFGRVRPYGVYNRANTKRALKRLGTPEGLRIQHFYYVPAISHFFKRSRLLYTAAYAYNRLVIGLGMPWLLDYMVAVLVKQEAE